MAGRAFGVDFRSLVFHQFGAAGAMYKMTSRAANLVLGVSSSDASAGRMLIQVAAQTSAIHLSGGKLGRITNIVGRGRVGVFDAGTMTGFAGFLLPTTARARFDCEVRGLLKIVVDF